MRTAEEDAKASRAALDELKRMSRAERFQIAVRAGIFTKSGELTAPYRAEKKPRRARKTARSKKR